MERGYDKQGMCNSSSRNHVENESCNTWCNWKVPLQSYVWLEVPLDLASITSGEHSSEYWPHLWWSYYQAMNRTKITGWKWTAPLCKALYVWFGWSFSFHTGWYYSRFGCSCHFISYCYDINIYNLHFISRNRKTQSTRAVTMFPDCNNLYSLVYSRNNSKWC